MKEMNMKSMAIGAIALAAVGAGLAFAMGKKDTKTMLTYAAAGLAVGAIGGHFVNLGGKKHDAKLGAAKAPAAPAATAPAAPAAAAPATPAV